MNLLRLGSVDAARLDLVQMTRAAEYSREPLSAFNRKYCCAEDSVACVKYSDWLIADDFKTIAAECAPPPAGMKQPELGNDTAALAVPSKMSLEPLPNSRLGLSLHVR